MTKINDSIGLRILIVLGSIIFVAGGFYVVTDFRLDAVEADATKTEVKLEEVDADVDTVENAVSLIQYDIRYIKNELMEQKEISKQILMELQK
jgi:hypothetical protein